MSPALASCLTLAPENLEMAPQIIKMPGLAAKGEKGEKGSPVLHPSDARDPKPPALPELFPHTFLGSRLHLCPPCSLPLAAHHSHSREAAEAQPGHARNASSLPMLFDAPNFSPN